MLSVRALFSGGEVSKTISKGVLDTTPYTGDEQMFAWAMVCVLVGSCLTTLLATIYGYPISATHSIIASLVVRSRRSFRSHNLAARQFPCVSSKIFLPNPVSYTPVNGSNFVL